MQLNSNKSGTEELHQMNQVMNIEQLAAYLQMSRASIYHLVSAGRIPGTKVGRQWRFFRDTIDAWLRGMGQPAADVLVVEDDALVRELVIGAFVEAGHHATGADSVEGALALVEEVHFDIVFLDLLLPDGTGLDVAKRLSGLEMPPEIVLITGYPQHDAVEEMRALVPYLTVMGKPARIQSMLDLAARAVAARPRT